MPEPLAPGSSACEAEAWDFSRAEEVWREFSPLTPRGRDAKEARIVLADRREIEGLYDGAEGAAAALARMDGAGRDRLIYLLGRIPRLPDRLGEESEPALDAIDVFIVKKFLVNYRAILELLDGESRARFGLTFESEALSSLLAKGGSDDDSFFVSDAYDAELASVRGRIRAADAAIALRKGEAEAAAMSERGLSFRGRSFLVLPAAEAASLFSCEGELRFSVEPYDSSNCIARILPSERELRAQAEREGLLGEERARESLVLTELSAAIAAESGGLGRYERALLAFDLARARAVLASGLGLTRPRLGGGRLAIARGRLIPCEADCARRAQPYRPLDLELDERAALLFGSNMGGKTVALQTALCLQVLAQAGLFVPADRFETEVYARLAYVGAPRPGCLEPGMEADGLSGFGREVESLARAWRMVRDGGAFVILDELGRTTSSSEAEAIVAATAEAFAAAPGTRCLLATHFRGTSPSRAVARLRMAGLDRAAARAAAAPGLEPAERARRIGALMRYEIVREDGSGPRGNEGSDALEVAALLGLDEGILAGARSYYSARLGHAEGDRG